MFNSMQTQGDATSGLKIRLKLPLGSIYLFNHVALDQSICLNFQSTYSICSGLIYLIYLSFRVYQF